MHIVKMKSRTPTKPRGNTAIAIVTLDRYDAWTLLDNRDQAELAGFDVIMKDLPDIDDWPLYVLYGEAIDSDNTHFFGKATGVYDFLTALAQKYSKDNNGTVHDPGFGEELAYYKLLTFRGPFDGDLTDVEILHITNMHLRWTCSGKSLTFVK